MLKHSSKVKSKLITVLRQGDCLGELALISNRPRAATVICREDTHFAVLTREHYQHILGSLQQDLISTKVSLIRKHPLFKTWNKDAVFQLSYYFKQRSMKGNQTLFTQGQQANEAFLVVNGEFKITKNFTLPANNRKKRQLFQRKNLQLATIFLGEFLGLAEALLGNAYESSCMCVSETGDVLVITAHHLQELVGSDAQKLTEIERKKTLMREEKALSSLDQKETTQNFSSISTEAYQKLMKRPMPPPILAPIVYEPRKEEGELPRSGTPWRMKNASNQGLASNSSEVSLPDIPGPALLSTSMETLEKRHELSISLWKERLFNPRKPRLITDGTNLYHYNKSLPALRRKVRK